MQERSVKTSLYIRGAYSCCLSQRDVQHCINAGLGDTYATLAPHKAAWKGSLTV